MNLRPAPRLHGGRCAPPAETLRRIETALAAACTFTYEEHRVSDDFHWGALLSDRLAMPAMGRGATSIACRISTMAEALEWLALQRRRSLPGYRRARQDELPDPLRIETLIAHVGTVSTAALERIKDCELAQHWVAGHSIRDRRPLQVPLEYVHGIGGTNGLAAGNTLEEAIVQGAYEIIERRAVITVARHRMVVPTVDEARIGHPVVRRQLAFLKEAGIQVTIKDLSFGGALPCIGVLFVRPDIPEGRQARHVFKAAASFDRASALMSCLTEFAQTARIGPDAGTLVRDDEQLLAADDDNFLPLFWFGYLPWRNPDFLLQGEVVPFDAGVPSTDCLEDIRRIQSICAELEKDFVAVDLTDPAAGFPLVQVVIPGYSDILPYHPASSRVLFTGWTRELVMGTCQRADGTTYALNARSLFA